MKDDTNTYWKCEASLCSSCPVAWWSQTVVLINGLPYQINFQNDSYGSCPTKGGVSMLSLGFKPTKREAATWLIAHTEAEIEDGRKKINLIKAWLENETP